MAVKNLHLLLLYVLLAPFFGAEAKTYQKQFDHVFVNKDKWINSVGNGTTLIDFSGKQCSINCLLADCDSYTLENGTCTVYFHSVSTYLTILDADDPTAIELWTTKGNIGRYSIRFRFSDGVDFTTSVMTPSGNFTLPSIPPFPEDLDRVISFYTIDQDSIFACHEANRKCYEYNLGDEGWTLLAPLPWYMHNYSRCRLRFGTQLVFPGYGGAWQNRRLNTSIFDTDTKTWRVGGAQFPHDYPNGFGCLQLDDNLGLFIGCDDKQLDNYYWYPDKNTLPLPPHVKNRAPIILYNHKEQTLTDIGNVSDEGLSAYWLYMSCGWYKWTIPICTGGIDYGPWGGKKKETYRFNTTTMKLDPMPKWDLPYSDQVSLEDFGEGRLVVRFSENHKDKPLMEFKPFESWGYPPSHWHPIPEEEQYSHPTTQIYMKVKLLTF